MAAASLKNDVIGNKIYIPVLLERAAACVYSRIFEKIDGGIFKIRVNQ